MHPFFETYTRGLTAEEFQRLFTRDAREAYRFLARGIDTSGLTSLPWHTRLLIQIRLFFFAFTLKLTPARRALYGIALVAFAVGALIGDRWWLGTAFVLINLLVVLEVVDRFTLKNDLEIARDIQQAMLPQEGLTTAVVDIAGRTRPANTVGGDFYDILPLADGRVVVTVGDVAGKGSPASLLMALLLAMLRTLVDEHFDPTALAERLNVQIAKHAPASRFITLFLGVYDPATGQLVYVNAGHTPALLRRWTGSTVSSPEEWHWACSTGRTIGPIRRRSSPARC